MKKKYKHLFFDIDNTLWDFDNNSKIVLGSIFDRFELHRRGVKTKNIFVNTYKKVNKNLWLKYRDGILSKEVLRYKRFLKTLETLNIKDKNLSERIGEFYVSHSPIQKKLMPGAKDVLFKLSLYYNLHIITNGFKEVQFIKLKNSNIYNFFDNIVVSEDIGFLKPNQKIFSYALEICNAKKHESLMIGDDIISDIQGARDFGIDQVFYNYKFLNQDFQATHVISNLVELESLLI